jgi:hypothetical protein
MLNTAGKKALAESIIPRYVKQIQLHDDRFHHLTLRSLAIAAYRFQSHRQIQLKPLNLL